MSKTAILWPASGLPAANSASPHKRKVCVASGPALVCQEIAPQPGSGSSAVIVRVDWQNGHDLVDLPDMVVTPDALIAKHVDAGRAEKLAAARKRLSARMAEGSPTTLQEARLAVGLSQMELAKMLGTSQPRVARLEAGREPNPGLRTLLALCKALKLDMNAMAKLF